MSDEFELFFQLTKVDEATRQVWGRATEQKRDLARETMHYDSSKPNFQKWSQEAIDRTAHLGPDAMSLGNIREMHGSTASGKAIAIEYDDLNKAIDLGTVCVDDGSWAKIRAGVLTGFSIGGVAKRWRNPANPSEIFYTAEPNEISYVDAPCLPSAKFAMIKADGSTEMLKVGYGLTVADENPANIGQGANIIEQPNAPDVTVINTGEIEKEIAAPAGAAPNPALIDPNRAVMPINSPRTEPVAKADAQPETANAFAAAVNELSAVIKARQDSEKQAADTLQKLGARVGITRREGAPLTAGPGFSMNSADWGDPANLAWPMDTSERVQSAIAKYNQGFELSKYQERERHILGHRIANQAKLLTGIVHQYDAKSRMIKSLEDKKMLPQLTKGVDVQDLVSQLVQGINVAADQIAKDPGAAKDMLFQLVGNLQGATSVSSVDTSTSNPSAPQGSQQDYTDTTVGKAAMSSIPSATLATAVTPTTPSVPTQGVTSGATPSDKASAASTAVSSAPTTGGTTATTVSTPSSSPSSPSTLPSMDKMDQLTDTVAKLAETVAKMMQGATPVQKSLIPFGDVIGAIPVNEPEPMHPALKILLEGGDNALLKAAKHLGGDGRPDIQGVYQLAREQAIKEGAMAFTVMGLRKGYINSGFVPTMPVQLPAVSQ